MKVCFFSHRGKIRKNNEDALLIGDKIYAGTNFEEVVCRESNSFIFSVADGMGGYEGGELASRIVLETFKEIKPADSESLNFCLKEAKKRLEDYVAQKPELVNMGSTLAGIILRENRLLVFNIGDCRVYRVLPKRSIRLSRDHSLVERLILEGVITKEEAKNHPQRHVITSALMIRENFEVYTTEVELLENDRFLICSDGLWEEREDFSELFEDPKKFVKELFDKYSLKDNFSFIAMEL